MWGFYLERWDACKVAHALFFGKEGVIYHGFVGGIFSS